MKILRFFFCKIEISAIAVMETFFKHLEAAP